MQFGANIMKNLGMIENSKPANKVGSDCFLWWVPIWWGESSKDLLLAMAEQVFIFDNGVSTERGRGQRGLGNLCMMKVELGLLVGGMTWHDGWSKKVGLAPIFTSYPPLFTPMCPILLSSYTSLNWQHPSVRRQRQNWPKFGLCFA